MQIEPPGITIQREKRKTDEPSRARAFDFWAGIAACRSGRKAFREFFRLAGSAEYSWFSSERWRAYPIRFFISVIAILNNCIPLYHSLAKQFLQYIFRCRTVCREPFVSAQHSVNRECKIICDFQLNASENLLAKCVSNALPIITAITITGLSSMILLQTEGIRDYTYIVITNF